MKGRILEILKNSDSVVSGETLSNHLEISRVSVWKHIKKLQACGYDITSGPKGYRLVQSSDFLFPWEFPGRSAQIHYVDETTSTMDIARELARKGCRDLTVVIAAKQHTGRGRLNRKWLSSEGGLYFTLVLRPLIPPVLSPRVNFAVSFVLAETLRNLFGIEAMVKWPNDILVHDKKVAGILSELESVADRVTYVNVGIGINVNNDTPSVDLPATTIKEILGRPVSRRDLLEAFLDAFETRMAGDLLENVIPMWKKYMITLNRHVRVVTVTEIIEGVAVGVDETGALIVQLADGSTRQIIYGDCFHD
jgi:BirA family transcriptional regulator, biotin operon repressor / biotin---[acetyl-CoA-carboxylase] ligase